MAGDEGQPEGESLIGHVQRVSSKYSFRGLSSTAPVVNNRTTRRKMTDRRRGKKWKKKKKKQKVIVMMVVIVKSRRRRRNKKIRTRTRERERKLTEGPRGRGKTTGELGPREDSKRKVQSVK